METEIWKAIQLLFERVNRSVDTIKIQEDQNPEGNNEVSYDELDLVKVRSDIRAQFDHLRSTLIAYLSEQECYQVLFPLVVYFDEQVQAKIFKGGKLNWHLLQKELYEVDNGGELFYNILDSILRKPQTSQLIFEVNFFCLKHGFLGKYVDDPIRIRKYMDQLEEKISIPHMEGINLSAEEPGQMKYFASPLWLYGGAGLFLITFYGLLRFIA